MSGGQLTFGGSGVNVQIGDGSWNLPFAPVITPDGSKVYVADIDAVVAIRTSDGVAIASIPIAPASLAITPDGAHVYSCPLVGSTVTVIRTSDNTIVATIEVGNGPDAIAVSPDGTRAFVINYTDATASVIRTSDNTVIATPSLGAGPFAIAVRPDSSSAYFSNNTDGTITVVTAATGAVSTTITGTDNAGQMAMLPDGSALYIGDGGSDVVYKVDLDSNTVIDTITVGSAPGLVTITSDGTQVYAINGNDGTISAIQTSDDTVTATITPAESPFAMYVVPDGGHLYVATTASTVEVYQTSDNTLVHTISGIGGDGGFVARPDSSVVYAASPGNDTMTAIAASGYATTSLSALVSLPGLRSTIDFQSSLVVTDLGDGKVAVSYPAPAPKPSTYALPVMFYLGGLTASTSGAVNPEWFKSDGVSYVRAVQVGSIVGIVASLSRTITAGTLTVNATINGTPTSLNCLMSATDDGESTTQDPGIDTYNGADEIGVSFSADDSFSAGETTNLYVWVLVAELL